MYQYVSLESSWRISGFWHKSKFGSAKVMEWRQQNNAQAKDIFTGLQLGTVEVAFEVKAYMYLLILFLS